MEWRFSYTSWFFVVVFFLHLLGRADLSQASEVRDQMVYDDRLAPGFEDWSWAPHELMQSGAYRSGTHAIRATPAPWEALYFQWRNKSLRVKDYGSLQVWVKSTGSGERQLKIAIGQRAGDQQHSAVFKVGSGDWTMLELPLEGASQTLGLYFDKVYIQAWDEKKGGDILVDDVLLRARPRGVVPRQAARAVKLELDSSADAARPISDLIYGTSAWVPRPEDTKLAFPLRRIGGNSMSRYNYKVNATNSGADWFYRGAGLPYLTRSSAGRVDEHGRELSMTDYWALEQHDTDRDLLLTIPMMGWVTKDRDLHWGYPVHRYGPQKAVESDESHKGAGNGLDLKGRPILAGDATLTSIRVGPDFVADWIRHLHTVTGRNAAKGGVRLVALDNEPSIWHQTHQDIRYGDPSLSPHGPVGFDEIWSRTVAYASQIKKADPAIQILGPDAWGWCDYFGFGLDQCEQGADRKSHGGKPFLQWYLQNVCQYKKTNGVQLVDYLDIHFYPANIRADGPETLEEQGKRLDAVRSWWDPSYVDGSWIKEPIALIPRMKKWIQESCPGMKLAVTEWRWGISADSISTALAHAESLLIFGREGLDLASLWSELPSGSLGEDAFKIFLNYDARGASALGGRSLVTKSSDPAQTPGYGIATKDRLLLYVLNKSQDPASVAVKIPGGHRLNRQFVLDDKGLREVPVKSEVTVLLPELSLTLFELTPLSKRKSP